MIYHSNEKTYKCIIAFVDSNKIVHFFGDLITENMFNDLLEDEKEKFQPNFKIKKTETL